MGELCTGQACQNVFLPASEEDKLAFNRVIKCSYNHARINYADFLLAFAQSK